MAFKFKDLIVTLIPHGRGIEDTGGCGGGTCDAGSGTVGSCTSECGGGLFPAGCGQSDEVLDPLKGLIDPQYLVDLRLMLRLAIAKSQASRVAALEANMQPRSVQEVDMLEKRLKETLTGLSEVRQRLQQQK